MSLTDYDVKKLRDAADYFGVDLEGVKGKLNIVQAIEDMGVDYTMVKEWQDRLAAAEPAPELPAPQVVVEAPVVDENTVLIKMERLNVAYDTYGFTFTREHPFCAVPESVAELILENEEGFRPALQKELETFYS